MRRIMIVGGPGAGKSTLGVALGETLGLPVYHTDRMFFQAGWTSLSQPERQAQIDRVLASSTYVLEGGYEWTFPTRLADCDTLIWLDRAPLVRAWRLWWRLRRAGHSLRPDLADGCCETAQGHAGRLWQYFWCAHFSLQATLARMAAEAPSGVRVVRLTSDREVARFLAELQPVAVAAA